MTIPTVIDGMPVNGIARGAFAGTAATSVTIPNSVWSIAGGGLGGCSRLTAITEAFNPFYSSLDGVLFNNSQTTLIQCPGGKTGSYTIPSTAPHFLRNNRQRRSGIDP